MKKNYQKNLISNIRNLLRLKGVGIGEMEKELKISPGLISRWGKKQSKGLNINPNLDILVSIAWYLDVSIDYLIRHEPFEDQRHNEFEKFLDKLSIRTETYDVNWSEVNSVEFIKKAGDRERYRKELDIYSIVFSSRVDGFGGELFIRQLRLVNKLNYSAPDVVVYELLTTAGDSVQVICNSLIFGESIKKELVRLFKLAQEQSKNCLIDSSTMKSIVRFNRGVTNERETES